MDEKLFKLNYKAAFLAAYLDLMESGKITNYVQSREELEKIANDKADNAWKTLREDFTKTT